MKNIFRRVFARSGLLVAVVVILGAAGMVYAFTYSTSAGSNTNPIQIGSITGHYGHVGAASTTGANIASGRYGSTCSGSCCNPQNQPLGTIPNILMVAVTWQAQNQSFNWIVEATSEIKNKSASTVAFDDKSGQCGPQPVFSTTSTVNMTEAATGASGGTTYLPGAEASVYSPVHTPPATSDTRNSASGSTWQDSAQHQVYDTWLIDPDDADSLTYTYSATVLTGFMGNASEVINVVSQHGADCILSVAVMSP